MTIYKHVLESYLIELFHEDEELERAIKELDLKTSYEVLKRKFMETEPVVLTDEIWRNLKNTDYDVNTEKDVKNKLKTYGRDPENYDSILSEIKEDRWYPSLIIKLKNGTYYLIAGNTRLMVCKVNNIEPKVKIIEE